MPATKLGLYELLTPQFLVGFTFPDYIDQYLAVLGVDELHVASDESGVVYTGQVSFGGTAGASPVRQHHDPSGAVFEWEDVTLGFRLTIPRDGAAPIHTAVTNTITPLTDLDTLFNRFGAVEQTATVATEYPGLRFRLELLVSALTFHLGKEWKPGEINSDHRIVPSTDPDVTDKDVRFVLPKVVLQYEQGDDPSLPPEFILNSWGNAGFDAPHDLAEGELVRMVPPIAVHESGRFGFGVEQILLDLSPDHTPPEILEFFGTDESFKGLLIKSLRFYYSDENKDFGLNIAVKDALISFAGQVSLELSVDLLLNTPLSTFSVEVHFFNGPTDVSYTQGNAADGSQPLVLTGGRVTVPNTSVVQVHISGGFPTYTTSVKLDGSEIWDSTRNDARLSPGMPGVLLPPGDHNLVVTVDDSATTVNHYAHTIALTVTPAQGELPAASQDGSSRDRPPEAGTRQNATLVINPADEPLHTGYALRFTPSTSGESETLVVDGGSNPRVRISNGATNLVDSTLTSSRSVSLDVPHGVSYDVVVDFPGVASGVTETFNLYFDLDKPYAGDSGQSPRWPAVLNMYASDNPAHTDTRFGSSTAPSGGSGLSGAAALKDWINNRLAAPKSVSVDAFASFETDHMAGHDQDLSDRRRQVAVEIIGSLATVAGGSAHGHSAASASANPEDRVVKITGTISPATPSKTVRATLARAPRPSPTPPSSTPTVKPNPAPPAPPDRRPTMIKRLSFRVRLERNIPVMIEFSGELDFETEMEQRLRTGSSTSSTDGNLGLTQTPNASATATTNPQDGVVDFKINVTYDTSTKQLTETLTLGAAPGDLDGLLRMENPRGPSAPSAVNRFKDIFGALLTFAPVINSSAAALDTGSAGDWTAVVVSLAIPVAIGGLDIFRTKSITLYGGEMKFRQFLPSGSDPLRFTDAGIVFDYGVEFGITVQLLGINTTRPLKVRYKAIGFNLHFEDGVKYQPIFDTSKGYEIDLSDPGLFNLPSPLGDLLKILAARIARFNPLTLELDFALKVDLGVVTVDRFKIKVPLDPPGVPMILPTGAKVNIPSALIGSGYVNIIERTVDGVIQKGIEGSLDLSVVPPKIRIAASLGLISLSDPSVGRKAVAVFVGLVVEFPTPIVLFSTGLGIYGFNGLFAMHYMRAEDPRAPGDSVSPALRWLIKAEGEPSKLINSTGASVWTPKFDRWSFGIGVILGTLDTGFVLNLRGTFVLELPGPRILIFVKILFIAKLPDLKPAADLQIGILGVVDLDFTLGQLTIGVMVNLEIKDLITVALPIEIYFKFSDLSQWHFYMGTIAQPATAMILNLVRARGYFMAAGDKIENFPKGDGSTITLPGIAIATGISASVVFGSEDIGLYLRVAAAANLGVAFSPLFIVGNIKLEGELRLFIISIEAHGSLTVEAPQPTIIHGEVCGKVDFFFFSVEGCVSVTIGSGTHALPAPAMVRNLYLQSRAPVLTAGQGGDRPIDASLGDGAMLTSGGSLPPGAQIPVVPIDTIPVIQLHASPNLAPPTTFTLPIVPAPGLAVPGGWINVGGGRQVRYLLKEISLNPPLILPSGVTAPPATWRTEHAPGPQGANTNIDLALFSWVPTTSERALERSSDLNSQVTIRWSNLCDPVAPPTCVLWTFCGQPLGPSGSGWQLSGIPQPDPPGTTRTAPPPTQLYVEEPELTSVQSLLNLAQAETSQPFEVPARVIGYNPKVNGRDGQPKPVCVDFRSQQPGKVKNPFEVNKIGFTTLDANGQVRPANRIAAMGGLIGLDIGFRLDVQLPELASQVDVVLVTFAQPAVAVAFDNSGQAVAKTHMTGQPRTPETLSLVGKNITRLEIITRADESLLLSLCYIPQGERQQPPTIDSHCLRALQLPYLQSRKVTQPIKIDRKLAKITSGLLTTQWIKLHTGAAESVTIFMAVAKRAYAQVILRELDSSGAALADHSLTSLAPQTVTGTTGILPADWLDPSGPWNGDIQPVASFLAFTEFASLSRLVVIVKPDPKCVTVEIIVPSAVPETPPQVLVAAVEVCSLAEVGRAAEETAIQTGQIDTVTGYLDGSALMPLLEPNTLYTLAMRYDAESKDESGTTSTESDLTQSFQFQTDVKPPARLDAYVLGTTPNHEEHFVFYDDVMHVVFNDIAVVQLYQKYGKKLRAVLRAADGVSTPAHEITTLNPTPAVISTPYREALQEMIDEGRLPCSGETTTDMHGTAILPFPLRPLMAYNLDIELDPADPPPVPAQPVVPLFRRNFTTSKYASLAELAATLGTGKMRHRVLDSQVIGLPGGPVVTATDQDIQNALVAAGEQALPAPEDPGITVYWAQRSGSSSYSPHIIMLDTPEPLWRTRSEPIVETVPDQDDPAYKRVIPHDAAALEVVETGSSAVERFVHAPGGTRTLAFIKDTFTPSSSGTPVTLTAHRPVSALYGITDLSVTLAVVNLTAQAPWEDDHV